MEKRYQQLNPGAMALAGGLTAVLGALVVWAPMMSMGGWGMMSPGHYGHSMMWGFGFGFVIAWWIGSGLLAAAAGAFFAWIYNGVNGSSSASR
jgi:hypothetical protein